MDDTPACTKFIETKKKRLFFQDPLSALEVEPHIIESDKISSITVIVIESEFLSLQHHFAKVPRRNIHSWIDT